MAPYGFSVGAWSEIGGFDSKYHTDKIYMLNVRNIL